MEVSVSGVTYVDLHVHTTHSDGTYTPKQVVQKAAATGIKVLAITDHDEMSGIQEAKEEAKKNKIKIIPGIECTTRFKGGNLHILGYNINPNSKPLKQLISSCQASRVEKIQKTLELLKEKEGIELTFEEVKKYSLNGTMGRPHIAQAMLEKGYISTLEEAFEKYIGKGKPAYVSGRNTTPEEVIKAIKKARGIPVLAHPFQMNLPTIEETLKKVESLVAVGLEGVEAIYPEHTQEQTYELIRYAAMHNLYVTAGSDFHGGNKPNKLGYCLENKEMISCNTAKIMGKMIF